MLIVKGCPWTYLGMVWVVLAPSKGEATFLTTVPLLECHILEGRPPPAMTDPSKASVVITVSRIQACLLLTASCRFVNYLINLLHCQS
jgi:hypothetical protein